MRGLYIYPECYSDAFGGFVDYFRFYQDSANFEIFCIASDILLSDGNPYAIPIGKDIWDKDIPQILSTLGKFDFAIYAGRIECFPQIYGQIEDVKKKKMGYIFDYINKMNCPVILYALDESIYFNEILEQFEVKQENIKAVFAVEPKVYQNIPTKIPFFYMPPHFEHRIIPHIKSFVFGEKPEVIFRGAIPPNTFRFKFLDDLSKLQLSIPLDIGDYMLPDSKFFKSRNTWNEMSQRRFVLSIPGNLNMMINRRIFGSIGSGKVLLSFDERSEMFRDLKQDWFFPPNEWFVHKESALFFKTPEEAASLINEYYQNEHELKRIWENGHKLLCKYHMPWHRAQKFISLIRQVL